MDILKLVKNNKNKRLDAIKNMYNMKTFNNNIFILGFGAIGHTLLWMLLKIIKVNKNKIYVFDKRDIELTKYEKDIYHNINFKKIEILEENYLSVLKNLSKNDLLIDCSYGISTMDLISLCNKVGANYINSCVETWKNRADGDSTVDTLYKRQRELEIQNEKLKKNHNAIVCMGCNPGNVSIWAQIGVDMIAKERKITGSSHAEKAQKLGIQVIHVTERDSQKSNKPKDDHEYCNTWSSDGEAYSEEILSCCEGSWGTHEKSIPVKMLPIIDGYFVYSKLAAYTFAQSYVPLVGRFIGNIVPHEECYSIGKNLTIKDKNGKILYKPSVYYVYHPCNDARMSIEELKDRSEKLQPRYRLLTKEIINGRDELGLIYFLEDGSVYWIGSLLSIHEAREVYENKYDDRINATALQVVIGYLTGILYLTELINDGKYLGTMFPEDLPYKKIFKWALPFLGDFVFKKVDEKEFKLLSMNTSCIAGDDKPTTDWQFENFLVYK